MKRQAYSDYSKRARARIERTGPGLDIPAQTIQRVVALRPKAATVHIANPALDQGPRRNNGPLFPGAKAKAIGIPAARPPPPPPKHPPAARPTATRPKAATAHIAYPGLDQGPRSDRGAGKKKKETIATKKALMPYFDIMDDPYFIKV